MPSSEELRLRGQLEEKEKELRETKLTIRNRDKVIADLKRKLERAQRMIGTQATDFPETIGKLSERVNQIDHDQQRMEEVVAEMARLLCRLPEHLKAELDEETANALEKMGRKLAYEVRASGQR